MYALSAVMTFKYISIYLSTYICLFIRAHECTPAGRGAEGERKKESYAGSLPSAEPKAGLYLRTGGRDLSQSPN